MTHSTRAAHRRAHGPTFLRRFRRHRVLVVVALAATACGPAGVVRSDGGSQAATGTTSPTAIDLTAPIALVQTRAGLAGVPVGSSTPRWLRPEAVAAPDGSAVFVAVPTAGAATIERLDPSTGHSTPVAVWRPSAGAPATVAAVEPGGRRVVLTAHGEGTTEVALLAVDTGTVGLARTFEGSLEPEAVATDGVRVFAARSYGDHYRITTLDLVSGEQHPTSGYDKTAPPEDMYGNVIQAVVTPDGTKLATLYRDAQADGHTAFVHLLDLAIGVTVCIDLYDPFGTGAPGTDTIMLAVDGPISVGHVDPATGDGVIASFDPVVLLSAPPQRHYHAEARIDPAPPALPAGVREVPGLQRFVAIAR